MSFLGTIVPAKIKLIDLPSELINEISSFLDLPSIVVFRMVNNTVYHAVVLNDFYIDRRSNKKQPWRGLFFAKACDRLNYPSLLILATNYGLHTSGMCIENRDVFNVMKKTFPYHHFVTSSCFKYHPSNMTVILTEELLNLRLDEARMSNQMDRFRNTYLQHNYINNLKFIMWLNKQPELWSFFITRLSQYANNIHNIEIIAFLLEKGCKSLIPKQEPESLIQYKDSEIEWLFNNGMVEKDKERDYDDLPRLDHSCVTGFPEVVDEQYCKSLVKIIELDLLTGNTTTDYLCCAALVKGDIIGLSQLLSIMIKKNMINNISLMYKVLVDIKLKCRRYRYNFDTHHYDKMVNMLKPYY